MRAGFSTVEVLIALVLFVAGVSTIAGGLALIARLDGDTWRRVGSVVAAQRRLEAARLACPDSGQGIFVALAVTARAARPPVADTLATEVACA